MGIRDKYNNQLKDYEKLKRNFMLTDLFSFIPMIIILIWFIKYKSSLLFYVILFQNLCFQLKIIYDRW